MQFPEQQPKLPPNYRGVHRLNRDEAGPGQVRGLLHVLDGLPGPLHRHRGGAVALARPREVPRDVRHRRAALHLLRHVRAGLPGGRHRADDAVST